MSANDLFYDGFEPENPTHLALQSLLGEVAHENTFPCVKVAEIGQPLLIKCPNNKTGDWHVVLENGGRYVGKIQRSKIELPDLPLGYHQLSVDNQQCRLIITPKTAYQPEALVKKQKLWGAILQLYTLRSERNWGIGDFSDLKQFLCELAKQGGDFVGLNPIHALFPANPESASPYSPSSRLWQNLLYIDVQAVEAFQQSAEAQAWFNQPEIQQQLAQVRYYDYVDYSQVTSLKLHGLKLAFAQFCQQDQTEFEQFIATHGENLHIQGTFDALHEWLSAQYSEQWGWDHWFADFQDYRTACVEEFQAQQAELVRFYMWTQFIATQQLAECNRLAQTLRMPIGFYRDLAVGVAHNGAETWADKSLYVLGASVGAPPDMLAPQGQNWGLSPMHPRILQERGYQPFIDLLRANMKDCGALRIDHILGFARLWWVLNGDSATNGVYIRYPLDDLLGILALESQRHQCLIIAEALGVVPDGILDKLEQKGILAYNVFYFEFDGEQSKPLENYPYTALTTLSTHDLPTVKGYWQEYDIELGKQYNIYPSQAVLDFVQNNRTQSKNAFRQALEQQGLEAIGNQDKVSTAFNHRLQTYVADTHSALFGTQPEDWLDMLEPVNIPGTSSEYPNWRRKLAKTTEKMFADEKVKKLLDSIESKRAG